MKAVQSLYQFVKNIINLRSFDLVSLQMGKVGSSSILRSYPTSYQGHNWDASPPIKYFSSNDRSTVIGHLFSLLRWRIKFYIVRRVVAKKRRKGESVKLIIGVREPVARNISGYFQSLNRREDDRDVASHILKFFCFCPHLAPLYWLDNEILRNFGVDVYSHDFDKDLGYSRFHSNGFDVFVYKLECLNFLEPQLADFLEVKDFTLVKANAAEDSDFAELYKHFRGAVRFEKAYLDCLYSSKMVQKFYSEEEVAALYKRWQSVSRAD